MGRLPVASGSERRYTTPRISASSGWPSPATPPPMTTRPGLKKLTRLARARPSRCPPLRTRPTATGSPAAAATPTSSAERRPAAMRRPPRAPEPRDRAAGGRGDAAVLGGGPARRREPVREALGAAGAGGGLGVAGQRRAPEERLEAAVVAAGAGGPRVLDPDVPDVAGRALDPAVDLAVQHDAAPDARADLDEQEVVDAAGGAGVPLPERHDVDVVVDHHGRTDGGGEGVTHREAVPAG